VNNIQLLPLCVSLLVCGFGGIFFTFSISTVIDGLQEKKLQERLFSISFGFFLGIASMAFIIGGVSGIICFL